ncbi:hypothetical protein [Miltoncostaea marina]|uniref:restriction endonuclease subunit S n=1 Tax=Miltoncostaea marina TaxID=2843215 RepID=UPI001C3DF45C|nr:hypothetical protein [Miltoncostaea marina]
MATRTAPLWSLATCNDEALAEDTYPDLEFEYIDIGNVSTARIKGSVRVAFGDAPSRARRVVRSGDLIISTVRTYLRAVATVPPDRDGDVVSTGFAVLRARPGVSARYLYYVVLDPGFIDRVVARSEGVSYPAITTNRLVRLHVWSRTPEAQTDIASFLDRECDRIESASRSCAALGGRLRDLERDIADRLVGGLETRPLKSMATVQSGLTLNEAQTREAHVELPYLRVANVKAGWIDLSEVKHTAVAPDEIPRFSLREGDLLLTEGGDLDKLGRGAVWSGAIAPCLFQNHVFAVRPRTSRCIPAFLSWATRSSAARDYFQATASRITNIASTNKEKLGRWPVATGEEEELRRRLARADEEWAHATEAWKASSRLVGLLAEYRDSVVHEAVAGKLDVAAASEAMMSERLHAVAEGEADRVSA